MIRTGKSHSVTLIRIYALRQSVVNPPRVKGRASRRHCQMGGCQRINGHVLKLPQSSSAFNNSSCSHRGQNFARGPTRHAGASQLVTKDKGTHILVAAEMTSIYVTLQRAKKILSVRATHHEAFHHNQPLPNVRQECGIFLRCPKYTFYQLPQHLALLCHISLHICSNGFNV